MDISFIKLKWLYLLFSLFCCNNCTLTPYQDYCCTVT